MQGRVGWDRRVSTFYFMEKKYHIEVEMKGIVDICKQNDDQIDA